MKMKIILTTTIFALILSSFTVSATLNSYDLRLYQSYKTGDMTQWVKVIDELNQLYKKEPSRELLFDITEAQYGYIGYLIGIKNSSEARKYIKIAERNVEKILSENSNNHDALAIKGSLYAYHIALSPYKAPFLGPQSMKFIDEAYKTGSNSPQVLIEKGNAAHYAPSLFGGDPKKATEYYTKAAKLLEKSNNGNPPKTWIYLNTLAQLALAFEKSDEPANAEQTYQQILKIAPDFKWVKEKLYPNFIEKRNS
ncbi:MAG TPA: tetratricopeptide repeat protein [Tenuifilaceae bacterium]|nr:tetratricopeptide repeat protein [Tenuifilaceae bacterium]HPE18733.1 tetratricopeptide repeat protein [Tenuifilaceae bacterium]HPJ46377.1 tetratricopeptide repeat protein [Tenuifilaceae bacterium]HPQ34884.1 tetratricopeptide repeat protein [Tenuifilaceae bacterium]HRX68468.1 tetratricopeptide repeat protein [Tenuifilaceae bacterium]